MLPRVFYRTFVAAADYGGLARKLSTWADDADGARENQEQEIACAGEC
jgi:hypothetical protein